MTAAETEERDPLLGRTLAGLYRIEELIGEGGIGRVYRAEHMALRKSVAVKVLLEEYQKVPNLKQRFQREAMTLAALSHPNIVTIHDFRSIGQQTFLVMELIDGQELSELIEEGPVPPARAFGIFRQILRCLAYAHAKDLMHRDLKPANVLVRRLPDDSDHVEILDFGLAKFMDGAGPQAELTRTGLILGTPAYMAPEQGSGARADARSDVYAAGLILFELLTGRRPFVSDEPSDLIRSHLLHPPPPLSEACPTLVVPDAVQAFVTRALEKAPQDRFADGITMLATFDALPLSDVRHDEHAAGMPVSTPMALDATRPMRTPPPIDGTGPGRPRVRAVWLVAALVAVGGLAAGAWAIWTSVGDASPIAAITDDDGEAGPDEASPDEAGHGVQSGYDDETAEQDVDEGDAEGEASDEEVDEEELAELPPEDTSMAGATERPAARNPWGRRLPRALSGIRNRMRRGNVPSNRQLGPLKTYRRQNPSDLRAPLLMAHIYASRGWVSASLEQYERVYARDASMRGDPRMLRDLVRFAKTEAAHRDASDAVVEIYGAEARDRVDHELSATDDPEERARLSALRARL